MSGDTTQTEVLKQPIGPARSPETDRLQISDFWLAKSVHELADEQGAAPMETVDDLKDDTISEAEAAAFMGALGL